VRRLLAIGVVAAAALAAGVAPAGATNECRGLQVCVPVAGPWVVVPVGRSVPRPHVEFQLSCPRGYIVGGIDVELSDRAIDVSFLGRSGSPVNPGITTTRDAVFLGTYVGNGAAVASFRPHLGCIPASGGGGREPAAVHVNAPPGQPQKPAAVQAFAPGQPTTRRVKNVRLLAGSRTVAQGCAAGERLVAATYALGFPTAAPPGRQLVAGVGLSQAVRGDRVIVTARANAAARVAGALVQVDAVCAGGK
jgi:hypothetical protein